MHMHIEGIDHIFATQYLIIPIYIFLKNMVYTEKHTNIHFFSERNWWIPHIDSWREWLQLQRNIWGLQTLPSVELWSLLFGTRILVPRTGGGTWKFPPVWRGKVIFQIPHFSVPYLKRGVHILSPAAEKGEGQIGKMFSFRESSEWVLNGNE